ncbi:hypothetical protein V8E51_005593 [Hyaloscypha variabilis]
MPSTRRSRRLQGDPPQAEQTTSRTRKPNSNTLDEFSKRQTPNKQQGVGKRKKVKTPDRIRALTKLVEASTKILTAPVVTTNANKPPLEATTPSERASPTQARKKSNATPTNVPFDPTIEGESAHYVTLMITPVIDDSRKIDSVICQNYNVNLVVRDSLAALHKFVYRKYVKQ